MYPGASGKRTLLVPGACLFMSCQRMAYAAFCSSLLLPHHLLAARNFDLQKSEDMLRKVRPCAHEHPVSYTLRTRNYPQGLSTKAGASRPVLFCASSSFPLHPFLPQTRVPHSPRPGVPTLSRVSVVPGVALAGSWCPWAEGRGL